MRFSGARHRFSAGASSKSRAQVRPHQCACSSCPSVARPI
jgi:hypothetical protein